MAGNQISTGNGVLDAVV
jgi:hypothetical protein